MLKDIVARAERRATTHGQDGGSSKHTQLEPPTGPNHIHISAYDLRVRGCLGNDALMMFSELHLHLSSAKGEGSEDDDFRGIRSGVRWAIATTLLW